MNTGEKPLQVAILLYQGVTGLDAVGPWEVLSRMPDTEMRFVGKEVGTGNHRGRHTAAWSYTHANRNAVARCGACSGRHDYPGPNGR